MKSFWRNNSIFLTLCLLLIAALGIALLLIPKGDLHLWLCDRHSAAGDLFFRYYTQVAEWFPYVVCVALLLFSRIGDGVFASSAMLSTALVAQVIKHIVCAPRPLTWFATHMPEIQLPLAEGVRMNYWLSFPSGHTTSFFALAFVLCIIATRTPEETNQPKKIGILIQIVLFFLAALGGYSRIYLSQHFALDVWAGMCIGVGVSLLCALLFSRLEGKKWYNYRLFTKK